MKRISLPIKDKDIDRLKVGDRLLLTGTLYTARDAVHRILERALKKREKLPLSLKGITVYYTGPTPAPGGRIIGSCGPTTSLRMDAFTPLMLKAGVRAMIGKGRRSQEVNKAIKKYKAVYFLAPAGCGALLSRKIKGKKIVAFKELGPEAIYELEVRDFPVVVGIDSKGGDIFGKRRN
jgi:fumarate hydratase subunit beta